MQAILPPSDEGGGFWRSQKTEGETMKEYNRNNIPLAKTLRKNMTPWERKLWHLFLKIYPVRFQRQKAIGNYIADFYCAKARLVIELDGGGHYTAEQQKADTVRTQQLESMNLTVLRFCNLDIDREFQNVCEQIDRAVKGSLPQSASLTAPFTQGSQRKNCQAKQYEIRGFPYEQYFQNHRCGNVCRVR